jgi:hypothetical protein
VLNYSVLQRRWEIGIQVAVGVIAGVALARASARYTEWLFFHVKASDAQMLVLPSAAIPAARWWLLCRRCCGRCGAIRWRFCVQNSHLSKSNFWIADPMKIA